MDLPLVSHINGDGDLLAAWFGYYTSLGVTSFHLVVHGSDDENAVLLRLAREYPVTVHVRYAGEFINRTKKLHLDKVLSALRDRWVLAVDSDEFVELPLGSLAATIRWLRLLRATAIYAPMVQRLTADGSLDTPPIIDDPFAQFPLCSPRLYNKMGVRSATKKYPLFWCDAATSIGAGNHRPPNGPGTRLSSLRGVTHHFKWRAPVLHRLRQRVESSDRWRHESAGYLAYLEEHQCRIPTDDAFPCSRRELVRRGLLVPPMSRAFVLAGARRWRARVVNASARPSGEPQ